MLNEKTVYVLHSDIDDSLGSALAAWEAEDDARCTEHLEDVIVFAMEFLNTIDPVGYPTDWQPPSLTHLTTVSRKICVKTSCI